MDQHLLACIPDPSLLEAFSQVAQSSGWNVRKAGYLPDFAEFEILLPDILVVDTDLIAGSNFLFVKELSSKYPSVLIVLLADTKYSEEFLYSGLKSGARGWVFKNDPDKIYQQLLLLLKQKHFLKPFLAQLILEEFKGFTKGEHLLPLEDELLRQSARGSTVPEIQHSLNMNDKSLHLNWESIWQKLNINERAQSEIEQQNSGEAEPVLISMPETASGFPETSDSSVKLQASEPTGGSTPSESRSEALQLVTFCLDKEEFAFPITQLQEIQRMLSITPLPKVPNFVLGIANLRGTVIPVIDLRIKIGIDAKPFTKEARIMVINSEGKMVGVVVDSVKGVIRIDPLQLEPPPPLISNLQSDSIKAVVNFENRLILLLDLNRILQAEENQDKKVFLRVGE